MEDRSQDAQTGMNSAGMTTRATTRLRAANIVSPPGSKTPPSATAKKRISYPDNIASHHRGQESSEAVDAGALAKALKDYDEAGRRREHTPGTCPSRK